MKVKILSTGQIAFVESIENEGIGITYKLRDEKGGQVWNGNFRRFNAEQVEIISE